MALSLLWARVQSLAGELRSLQAVCGARPKKKKRREEKKIPWLGSSPTVQWLECGTFIAVGRGWIPGRGIKKKKEEEEEEKKIPRLKVTEV